ncbi:UNVERIFIED_CONTAM: hypothetical protein Slati_2061700 [Sesamum latifolium]|uniref:Uncharacterized protein n=1 Tax=Sesamum latifolium TaxID=2727402 RepID=A0AAW2WPR0_9LAMI
MPTMCAALEHEMLSGIISYALHDPLQLHLCSRFDDETIQVFDIGKLLSVSDGAEVAVLCITKSGEVLNYQAFTNSDGVYTVAETMPASERWDACLARPISSFHSHCTHLGEGTTGVKFSYNHPSGYSHTVRPFVYRPAIVPVYCT